jgi:hypothetical protein
MQPPPRNVQAEVVGALASTFALMPPVGWCVVRSEGLFGHSAWRPGATKPVPACIGDAAS